MLGRALKLMRCYALIIVITSTCLFHSMAFVSRKLLSPNLLRRHIVCRRMTAINSDESETTVKIPRGNTLRQNISMLGRDIWVLQFDGGSRGNPGRAGSGSTIFKSTIDDIKEDMSKKCILENPEEIWSGYHYLGESVTNNVAEYSGLIEGLKQAVKMRLPALLIQGDSQLILYQIEGKYKVKHEKLIPLHAEAKNLLLSIPNYVLEHIPRAQNARADELSNVAMDKMMNSTECDRNKDQTNNVASVISMESYSHALQLVDLTVQPVLTESKSDSDSDSSDSDSDSSSGSSGDSENDSDDENVPIKIVDMKMERKDRTAKGVVTETISANVALGVNIVESGEVTPISIVQRNMANILDSDIIFNESDHTLTITVSVSELLFHKLKEASAKNPRKLKKQIIITADTSEPKSETDSASQLIESTAAEINTMTIKSKSIDSIGDVEQEQFDEGYNSDMRKKIKKEKRPTKITKKKGVVALTTEDIESASDEKELKMEIR